MPLEQYEAMVESGIFTERDRLQLINGMLVAKLTQGNAYCTADDLCREALAAIVPACWNFRPNKPVRLPPDSEPEPDHAVVHGTIRDYRHGHPGPADVALVVEIAASSPREEKAMATIYANARIPIYWIQEKAGCGVPFNFSDRMIVGRSGGDQSSSCNSRATRSTARPKRMRRRSSAVPPTSPAISGHVRPDERRSASCRSSAVSRR